VRPRVGCSDFLRLLGFLGLLGLLGLLERVRLLGLLGLLERVRLCELFRLLRLFRVMMVIRGIRNARARIVRVFTAHCQAAHSQAVSASSQTPPDCSGKNLDQSQHHHHREASSKAMLANIEVSQEDPILMLVRS
jgi:hypothetical protein